MANSKSVNEVFDPGLLIEEDNMDLYATTLNTSGSESEKEDNTQSDTYILTSSNNNELKLTLTKPKSTINTNNRKKEQMGSTNINLTKEFENKESTPGTSKNYVPENKKIQNKFNLGDQGPFYVFIEHKDRAKGRLHPMFIGQLLHTKLNMKNDIILITSLDKFKIKVDVKTALIANK